MHGGRWDAGWGMTGHRIAIVDDSPEILALVCEVLDDAGFCTVTGTEADDVEGLLAPEHPDLLILDVRLPGAVTGLPLLRALRENRSTAQLPILVATADLAFLRENAGALKTLGCEALPKPFDIDSLLDCVASLLPVGKPEEA